MAAATNHTFDTIVVGGGQAGLITGHALREAGADFVILDASRRVGDAWRNRWDSLRLFTQARMNGLPGMDFPGPGGAFVGKEAVGDFLESYAREMGLPVESGTRVDRLHRDGDVFVATSGTETFRGRSVIVAMADYQKPRLPDFAGDLDPGVVSLHSSEYRNTAQLQDGPALVVGLGNSGADIAYELAQDRQTFLSGTASSNVPFKLEGWFGRNLGTRLVRFAMVRVLNTSTPMGRRARPKIMKSGPPLVRVREKDLSALGVERVGRIAGTSGGRPTTEDGTTVDVANVIWCTGYRPGFDWVDLPVFDDDGMPNHERGVVAAEPGLYFVGLFFLHSVWSETLTGAQPDVRHVVKHLQKNLMLGAS